MTNNFKISELVHNANYSTMSYKDLIEVKNTYSWVMNHRIDPILETKRHNEMVGLSSFYLDGMNTYHSTPSEIISCLIAAGFDVKHMFPSNQETEDQTSPIEAEESQEKSESVLALPEHSQTTIEEAVETMPMESSAEEDLNKVDTEDNCTENDGPDEMESPYSSAPKEVDNIQTNNESIVKEALVLFDECPLPMYIDSCAPYFVECSIAIKDNLEAGRLRGRNLDIKDLKEFKSASEKYVKLFLKKEVLLSTDEYLIYNEGEDSVRVRFYYFPEQACADVETPVLEEKANSYLSAIRKEDNKEKRRIIKDAIERAKELSFSEGVDSNMPFYDRYTFHRFLNIAELQKGPERFIEDATTLNEIMPAFETFAKYENEGAVVLSKDNCVAAMVGNTIYLVLFNIPKNLTTKKRRGRKQTKESITKKSSAPTEDPIIVKAVEMIKNLPVDKRTDSNAPYFIQCDFSVIGDGGLIQKGRPFSRNLDGMEELAQFRKSHLKFAKMMKAINPVSTEEYIAYLWNEGKNVSVFYYNTKDIEKTAA